MPSAPPAPPAADWPCVVGWKPAMEPSRLAAGAAPDDDLDLAHSFGVDVDRLQVVVRHLIKVLDGLMS